MERRTGDCFKPLYGLQEKKLLKGKRSLCLVNFYSQGPVFATGCRAVHWVLLGLCRGAREVVWFIN